MNIRTYTDLEIIEMLFADRRKETMAINYLIDKSRAVVSRHILSRSGTQNDINSILNSGLVILISNLKKKKFKFNASLHTYLVGICKMLWRNELKKNKLQMSRVVDISPEHTELATLSEIVERFEQLNENAHRLDEIYSIVTDKCRSVLQLWARGFNMEEISNLLGYKNAQISMNKKNTCLKKIIKTLKVKDYA